VHARNRHALSPCKGDAFGIAIKLLIITLFHHKISSVSAG
jgi:hypothetical protein